MSDEPRTNKSKRSERDNKKSYTDTGMVGTLPSISMPFEHLSVKKTKSGDLVPRGTRKKIVILLISIIIVAAIVIFGWLILR